ncbi:MAG: metallophosphoesterase [Leptolyngbyaceae cyanobacterium bins.302]|nr:metallophosphoesterase [Leptolyngbyaceae cyanobacterium bins.302]
MAINRRIFLILSSLGGLGAFALGKWFGHRANALYRADEVPITSAEPAIAPELQAAKPGDLLLRFVATADTGSGDQNQFAVGDAMARYHQQNPYNLVVLAGDNIYNDGEIWKIKQTFEEPYKAVLQQGVKFRACLGNHDIRTENGNPQVAYTGFNMPSRYYTFQANGVQFFALDTNGNADWEAQLTWLEKELQRSSARWKIVFGHHPIYASGVYGSNPEFIRTFTPLFKQYGVQLYINGHEHHYERTRSINGTTYLVTGHGGAHLRDVGKNEWTAYSVSRHGFTALEVYPDRIEIKGIGTNHQVFDRGTIARVTG